MERKAWVARAMALALLVPAASACSKGDDTQENIEVKTEAPPPATPMTVQINPQGGSKITGELVATHEAERTIVRINLSGLTEGKDYEAKVRYGDCAVAMQYLADVDEPGEVDKDKAPATTSGATPPATDVNMTTGRHDIGDVLARIDLDQSGMTATGSADVDNDELAPGEAAYVVITEETDGKDVLVGCADLTGHEMTAPGATTPAPTTEPGAAAPAPGTASEAPKK